jgi:feruloyl esterase
MGRRTSGKVIDFGWRAVHEMTVVSKQVIAAFYQSAARLSYWNGCSAGGRQAMKEAQRFPTDFDGIIAGAPGLDWTARAAQAVRMAKMLEPSEDARLLEPDLKLLHQAVLDACDTLDGVKAGVLENPLRCTFDPAVLECQPTDGRSCLTSAQVSTARGVGPSRFDPLGVLEQWVEKHLAPDSIVASHDVGGTVDRTRPLCPYPQTAAYKGSGSTNDATNFVCRP